MLIVQVSWERDLIELKEYYYLEGSLEKAVHK